MSNDKRFAERFSDGTHGLKHITTGSYIEKCDDCPSGNYVDYEDGVTDAEPFFSWSACECCGSQLGGNREVMHGVREDDSLVHLHVCIDCMYFNEYKEML